MRQNLEQITSIGQVAEEARIRVVNRSRLFYPSFLSRIFEIEAVNGSDVIAYPYDSEGTQRPGIGEVNVSNHSRLALPVSQALGYSSITVVNHSELLIIPDNGDVGPIKPLVELYRGVDESLLQGQKEISAVSE